MRTRIEVFQIPKEGKFSVEYRVDMQIGPYGRYEEVLSGKAVNEDRAYEIAEVEAERFLFERSRQNPISRKYLNIKARA